MPVTADQIEDATKAAHDYWGKQGMQTPWPAWEDLSDDIQEISRREIRLVLDVLGIERDKP